MVSPENPSAAELQRLLLTAEHIAIVGLSPSPHRPSHRVARALQGWGYRIIPVNPAVEQTLLGEPSYARLHDLAALDVTIDIVSAFRDAPHVDGIVDECIELGFPVLWLAEGVRNEAAAQRAREAGILTITDHCIFKLRASLEHR